MTEDEINERAARALYVLAARYMGKGLGEFANVTGLSAVDALPLFLSAVIDTAHAWGPEHADAMIDGAVATIRARRDASPDLAALSDALDAAGLAWNDEATPRFEAMQEARKLSARRL